MKTIKITYLALLTALGIILPSFFHIIGGAAAGKIFLPLHIPVLIAALLLGAGEGVFMGIFLPVLSSLITGMPSVAILPYMVLELSIYGLIAGLTRKFTKNVMLSLCAGLIGGRIIYALCLLTASYVFKINAVAAISVLNSFITGFTGVAIQIIFIPPIIYAVGKTAKKGQYGQNYKNKTTKALLR